MDSAESMSDRPTLEVVLRRMAATGRLTQLSLVTARRTPGDYQASLQRPGRNAFNCCVKPDPVEALFAALGPDFGQSWADHLRLEPTVGVDDDDDDLDGSHLI